MPAAKPLPDLLRRTREVRGDEVLYRFANGLTIKTEVFDKADSMRILPLGNPQGSLMNHVLGFPNSVLGKRVFEPFAGSGAIGLMALSVGAAHVDFLDINPRAVAFQSENAAFNGFPRDRFTSILADIAEFVPQRRYDAILANPPFVPTPEGIEGTITSNGGPDGSRYVGILLARLDELLESSGRALVYVFQLAREGRPLILDQLAGIAKHRQLEITPAQERPIPFEVYRQAYRQLFPDARPQIDRWSSALVRQHGEALSLCHYVLDIGGPSGGSAESAICENFDAKFGPDFVLSVDERSLALGRIYENVVAGRDRRPGGGSSAKG